MMHYEKMMQQMQSLLQACLWQEAEACAATQDDPTLRGLALGMLGQAGLQQQRLDYALIQLAEACRLLPDNASLRSLWAIALSRNGYGQQAYEQMRTAVELNPEDAQQYYNLGRMAQQLGDKIAARQAYDQAIQRDPTQGLACLNSANLCMQAAQWAQAADFLQRAEAAGVDTDMLLGSMIFLDLQQAIWDRWTVWHERVRALLHQPRVRLEPFATLSLFLTEQEQNILAQKYVQTLSPAPQRQRQRLQDRLPGRIRVLYVSSDFGSHAVTLLTAGLYATHDRDRFEIALLSLKSWQDSYRSRLEQEVEHLLDVAAWDENRILQWVKAFDPDIAVDLNGHTEGGRPELFAAGLAPVQLHYLGFPGGTGSPSHDYVLADPVVVPAEHADFFQECIVHLPYGFQINDDRRELAEPSTRSDWGWPQTSFLFASWNGIHKINPEIFGQWMQILRQCPNAALILVDEGSEVMDRLRCLMQNQGVDGTRLIAAPRISYAAHLGRLACVDLILDTLPYNGGTSTSDALWAGVPVLTCTGARFSGRMSTSLLHYAGLEELITPDADAYIRQAVRLYEDRPMLRQLRDRLQQPRSRQRLFATAPRTRAIEAAYVHMVEVAEQGLPPQSFCVDMDEQGKEPL